MTAGLRSSAREQQLMALTGDADLLRPPNPTAKRRLADRGLMAAALLSPGIGPMEDQKALDELRSRWAGLLAKTSRPRG